MAIHLSFDCANAAELLKELTALLQAPVQVVIDKSKLDKALDRAIDAAIPQEPRAPEECLTAAEEMAAAQVVGQETKPRRGRPRKDTPMPAHVQAAAAAPESAPAPAEVPAVTPETTRDEVFSRAKDALGAFVQAKGAQGREQAIAILKSLGVERLSDLDVSGLEKFIVEVAK